MVFRKERGFDRKSKREEWKPPVTGPAPEGGFVFEQGEAPDEGGSARLDPYMPAGVSYELDFPGKRATQRKPYYLF